MKYILLLLMMIGSLFANVGQITSINGKAFAQRGGSNVLLHKGSILKEKDVIKTMPNTRLQIVFNDHTVISLGQKTTFRVDKYAFNRKNQEARFSVTRGIFKSITGKIGHLNHSKYTLKTNNATIGVRGTIYVGKVERDRESIACTSGEIVVHTRRGSVVVKKGEMTSFTPFSKPSKPKRYKKHNLELFKGVVSKSDVKVVKTVHIQKVRKISKVIFNTNESIKKTEQKRRYTYQKSQVFNVVKDFGKNISEKVSSIGSKMGQVAHNFTDDFGDFAQDNMSETHENAQEATQDARNDNSYNNLIQRAGNSQLHYIGKVSGNNIVNDTYNKVDLNFDLGTASVSGKVKFKKEHNFMGITSTTNWNTNIAGHVNGNGAFNFNTTSNHYSGGGSGELTGEHLENASGTIDISKTEFGIPIANTKATFTATKQ